MNQRGKPKVLIADDEMHIRLLLKTVLTKMNCEIVGEATNGPDAIDIFNKEKPHLLLLDINMPIKKGDQVLEEIMAKHPDAFVIMLTCVVDMKIVEKCIGLGAANYIRKDTPIEEIKKIIKETWQTFRQKTEKSSDNV